MFAQNYSVIEASFPMIKKAVFNIKRIGMLKVA